MNKEIIKIIKLFLSSIFARKIKFIITCNENFLMYTNISVFDLQLENFNADHVIHYCFIKNDKILKILKDNLPFLFIQNYQINIVELLKILNKCKYDFSYSYDEDNNLILNANNEKFLIGMPISNHFTQCLISYYDDIKKASNNEYYKYEKIKPDKIDKSNVNHLTIFDKDINEISDIKKIDIPCIDGHTFVSVNEFYKKNNNNGEYTIHSFYDNNIIFRIFFKFENEDIKVFSYRPYMLFFHKRIQ